LSRESCKVAEAEAVCIAEGEMCDAAMRGVDAPPWSKTPSRTEGTRRNLGDLTFGRAAVAAGPRREGVEPKPMMNGREKSDPAVVAVKRVNKVGKPAAESVERRAGTEGNAEQQSTHRALNRERVSQALGRVREAARLDKKVKFTALLHHVDVDLLRLSYLALKRDAAAGVDGVTWQDYGADLEPRLADLHDRVHRGAYRAQPSRRVYIPKADGKQRPLAIAALEDKIAQRAVLTVLNQIYEEDFLGFSYGFRPERGQHDALDALVVGITARKVNWILDADIRSFFDTVSQSWLVRFLEHRIGDKRIIRLIQKWLKVGVQEDGTVTTREMGTGQGSVISPLLANIYLHYVLDLWAEQWRTRQATGDMIIVRYADDVVCGFQHEADAWRFRDALRERMGEFSLTLHPDKTRLIAFGRHAATDRASLGLGKPETFDFLGFTFICGKTRRGGFQVQRKSRRDRVRAKLKEIKAQLRRRRHQPIPDQGRWLKQVVGGFFAYHAVPTNGRALGAFRHHVMNLWRRTLLSRGQRDRTTWLRAAQVADDWLPKPLIRHPWPNQRFAVRHPRWEPDAGKPHVRFCAGGAQ
jgi:RNA-directed DNA polymerase